MWTLKSGVVEIARWPREIGTAASPRRFEEIADHQKLPIVPLRDIAFWLVSYNLQAQTGTAAATMNSTTIVTPAAPGATMDESHVPVISVKHPFNANQLNVLAAAVNTVVARQTESEIAEIMAEVPSDAPDVRCCPSLSAHVERRRL